MIITSGENRINPRLGLINVANRGGAEWWVEEGGVLPQGSTGYTRGGQGHIWQQIQHFKKNSIWATWTLSRLSNIVINLGQY